MYHHKTIQETFKELNASIEGLSISQAQQRLEEYGTNELTQKKSIPKWIIFLEQFKSPLVWILIGAIIISLLLKEYSDATIIGVVLIANAIFGYIQEEKAEKSIESLKRLASLKAKVIRGGQAISIDAKDIVPGDILVLDEGDKIPADARLIEIVNLECDEAALTGESLPSKKNLEIVSEKIPLGDMKNTVFSGTIITKGRAKAIVCETGMKTQIGKIAHLIQESEDIETPLQKNLAILGRWLVWITIIICIIILFAEVLHNKETLSHLMSGNFSTLLQNEAFLEFLIVAISLAVAAIPEGLPAVVTICLALGVQKMVKKNALIRKLPSVETLGCTTVICSDKTGTLTHNQMTIKKLWLNNNVIEVSGSGYTPLGTFSSKDKDIGKLLEIGALCNDSNLYIEEKTREWKITGDPTEAALVVSAHKHGQDKKFLEKEHPRISEIPFDSQRKRMSTLHKDGNKYVCCTKGAPDMILDRCKYIYLNGKAELLTKDLKSKIMNQNIEFANEALRVLGFAYKEIDTPEKFNEEELIFIGLQAMMDPPREEVKNAILKCKSAGIKVIMITGDFLNTAKAVASQLGIEGKAIEGKDIENINLDNEVEHISIYARVNPEHKQDIVKALQKKGHIVAMTGDGVNDAPALKNADIGIAMGITGTDVAKEASDMILTDDNFTSIVSAVEEGRTIYNNIRKFVEYLLSSNIGEVLTIFTAIMIGLPLPLLAIMILWINIGTDGLPALALGVDPAEKNVMKRPPRNPKTKILNLKNGIYLFSVGIIMMLGTLGIFYGGLTENGWSFGDAIDENSNGYMYATTLAFTTIMLFQMFNVINCRNKEQSTISLDIFSNIKLIGAIIISVLLQLLVIYTPLAQYFKTVPLSGMDWFYCILVSSSVLWFGEITKIFRRIKIKKVMIDRAI